MAMPRVITERESATLPPQGQSGEREQRPNRMVGKRLFDLALCAMAIVILTPLLAALALMVRVKLGTPILFKQQRPGRYGRPFTIFKFRTMTDARDSQGCLLPDAERLTAFGKFLRSSSLDELPELLNVLKGEMSMVGPRPLLMEYLPLYNADQARRHDVLPGITGLAQVNGRNAASWRRKFELDVWYVDHHSLALDLKILAQTIVTVLKREGISQPGRVTSERFTGREPSRETNVLLTCAGRRSFITAGFKEALREGAGKVLACDASGDAPALQQADRSFIVPQIEAPDYIEALLAICREEKVRLLVPALESELTILAEHRARFEAIGTLALVSSPDVIAICHDKVATAGFLSRCGLPVPKTYASLPEACQALARGEVSFPLILKPRWGVSSIAVHFVHDDEDLHYAYKAARREIAQSQIGRISARDPERCVLIQEQLSGEEYGLDVINDLEGAHVCTFVRRRLRARGGQTDRAVTLKSGELEKLGRKIGNELRHVGPLDCDVFVTARGTYAIDLNPRLGGAYPFSHSAGANLPATLIAWVKGEKPNPAWLQPRAGVTTARSDSFRVIETSPSTVLADESPGYGGAARPSVNLLSGKPSRETMQDKEGCLHA